jgi:adenosylcobinamide kinase/adenosylcobinamide-phosphate guanylyltransferase
MLTLVSGGAKSGKSRYAQGLCRPDNRTAYLATARVLDGEMADRVARHQADRPPNWTTLEEPVRIADTVSHLQGRFESVLIDCLTLWATNLMLDTPEASNDDVGAIARANLDALSDHAGRMDLILVTNEVGWGIVPDSALGRRFRDLHGGINQHAAMRADRVVLMVSGIPVTIKPDRSDRDL